MTTSATINLSELFQLKQGDTETLTAYIGRWPEVASMCPDLESEVALQAFAASIAPGEFRMQLLQQSRHHPNMTCEELLDFAVTMRRTSMTHGKGSTLSAQDKGRYDEWGKKDPGSSRRPYGGGGGSNKGSPARGKSVNNRSLKLYSPLPMSH